MNRIPSLLLTLVVCVLICGCSGGDIYTFINEARVPVVVKMFGKELVLPSGKSDEVVVGDTNVVMEMEMNGRRWTNTFPALVEEFGSKVGPSHFFHLLIDNDGAVYVAEKVKGKTRAVSSQPEGFPLKGK